MIGADGAETESFFQTRAKRIPTFQSVETDKTFIHLQKSNFVYLL